MRLCDAEAAGHTEVFSVPVYVPLHVPLLSPIPAVHWVSAVFDCWATQQQYRNSKNGYSPMNSIRTWNRAYKRVRCIWKGGRICTYFDTYIPSLNVLNCHFTLMKMKFDPSMVTKAPLARPLDHDMRTIGVFYIQVVRLRIGSVQFIPILPPLNYKVWQVALVRVQWEWFNYNLA